MPLQKEKQKKEKDKKRKGNLLPGSVAPWELPWVRGSGESQAAGLQCLNRTARSQCIKIESLLAC